MVYRKAFGSIAVSVLIWLIASILLISSVDRSPAQAPTTQVAKAIDHFVTANHFLLNVSAVHDGDTITAAIQLGYGVVLDKQRIRLTHYDAWEITKTRQSVTVTDVEVANGKLAQAALSKLIADAEAVYLCPDGDTDRDVYGRILGSLWLKQKGSTTLLDISAYMIANHFDRNVK